MTNNNINPNMLPDREFLLNKEISAESIKDVIIGIRKFNDYDDKQSKITVGYIRQPIKIIIDSFGGSCYSGMALVGMIETSETPIHTYCYGKAMSMGLTIFSAGHKRFAHKLATFMQHQLTSGHHGKLMDEIQHVEESVRLQEMLDNFLVDKTDIKKRKLLELRDRKIDWFFTGEEALELGLVDELITRPTKKGASV